MPSDLRVGVGLYKHGFWNEGRVGFLATHFDDALIGSRLIEFFCSVGSLRVVLSTWTREEVAGSKEKRLGVLGLMWWRHWDIRPCALCCEEVKVVTASKLCIESGAMWLRFRIKKIEEQFFRSQTAISRNGSLKVISYSASASTLFQFSSVQRVKRAIIHVVHVAGSYMSLSQYCAQNFTAIYTLCFTSLQETSVAQPMPFTLLLYRAHLSPTLHCNSLFKVPEGFPYEPLPA